MSAVFLLSCLSKKGVEVGELFQGSPISRCMLPKSLLVAQIPPPLSLRCLHICTSRSPAAGRACRVCWLLPGQEKDGHVFLASLCKNSRTSVERSPEFETGEDLPRIFATQLPPPPPSIASSQRRSGVRRCLGGATRLCFHSLSAVASATAVGNRMCEVVINCCMLIFNSHVCEHAVGGAV